MITPGMSLYGQIVRRIRSKETIFKQNVKLSLRQEAEDQISRLPLPLALVVPTTERPLSRAVVNDYTDLLVPRSVAIIAMLDARGSDQEYAAAGDIEMARYGLLDALVNWRPFNHYDATSFAGMRIEATKAPHVRVAFVFMFNEVLSFACDEVGCEGEDFDLDLNVRPYPECGEPICK